MFHDLLAMIMLYLFLIIQLHDYDQSNIRSVGVMRPERGAESRAPVLNLETVGGSFAWIFSAMTRAVRDRAAGESESRNSK